jgi:thiol-disulfide isomerase/thioredoxin
MLACLVAGATWPLLTARAAPAETAVTSTDPVDIELAAVLALQAQRPPEGTKGTAQYFWYDDYCQAISNAAFGFIEKHPTDPRRWKAAMLLPRYLPRFVKSIGDGYDANPDESLVVRDTAREAAWTAKVDAVEKEMKTAADVPDEVREQLEFMDYIGVMNPNYRAAFEGQPVDLPAVDAAIKKFLTRWPESESGRGILPMYVSLRKKLGATDEVAVLAEFKDSPNRAAREYVQARARFAELSKKPFELAFTALDGREVDLKKLRGKVVLIDFWATWCGPCIAEMPNVKKTYEELHDKGFEVIGVSLDSAKDRQKFIDLVAKEGVVWPQRFEGKGWNDSLAIQYTISGIPAMFLLDQQGNLVSTDARGEKLGQTVKKLLKL